jgi:hypothetical protein
MFHAGPVLGAVGTLAYAAAAILLRLAVPHAYEGLWLPLIALIVMHVARTTIELTRNGRIGAANGWLSGLFALLAVGTLGVSLASGRSTPLLGVALGAGILCEVERAARLWRRSLDGT